MLLQKLWNFKEDLLNIFGMTVLLGMFYLSPFAGCVLSIYLLFTPFYPIILIYFLWIYIDRKTPYEDGRRIEWVRSAKLHDRFRAYFPQKLIKTADIPPHKNYIFCIFPHGTFGIGTLGQFSGTNHEFQKLYPGINPVCHTLNCNFYFPLSRDYLLAVGFRGVSKEALVNVLSKGQGNASMLVVGGSAEAMITTPLTNKIILKDRKGFVKLAIQNGADLVPVFVFRENELYHHYIFPSDSIIHRAQQAVRSFTGVAPIFIRGTGFFQNYFGILPRKIPLYTVVGKPIPVEKNLNPTNEEVGNLHAIFVNELTNLFNKHKYNYLSDPDSAVLSIQ